MWLTRLAINRRVTIGMMLTALVVLGLVGLSRMPWDQFPKIDMPYIFISVPYPGAGPEEVEQGVVKPVENEVSVINGVQKVESNCQESIGSVIIQFAYGTDLNAAAADVRDALDRAQVSFPRDVENPQLFKLDFGALPVLIVGFTGERNPRELYRLIDDRVRPRLGQIPGVAAVSMTGGQEREIQVRADRERLDAVGLSLSQLAGLLAAQNLKLPAGSLKEGLRDYTVRVMGEFASVDEIRALRIATPRGGLVPLASLAEVLDTTAEAATISRVNSNSSITLSLLKQSEANTVSVCAGARREIERMVGTDGTPGLLPPDVKATIARDGSETVIDSIRDVTEALVLGALLASLVVFVFLHNLRATLIIFLCIPTAIISTFFPVGTFFGFTLNMMVLLGFSVAIGNLIDDAIVLLENTQRHLDMGELPVAAAYNGRTEIGGAAVAITLVDIVVFVPIALMGGIVGQFFFPFGITVATCGVFSLLVGFTLVPSLSAWWFTRAEKEHHRRVGVDRVFGVFYDVWDRGFDALSRNYRGLLRRAVAHPYLTLVLAYAALLATLILIFPRLGFGMFPVTDAGAVSVEVESSPGTRLEYTDTLLQQIEQRLGDKTKYPEIADLTATAGQSGSSFGGSGSVGGQYGAVFLTLEKRRARVGAGQRSDQELSRDLRRDLADLPGVVLKVNPVEAMGGGGSEAPIQVNLLSNDLTELGRVAQQLRRKMAGVPGLLYVETSSKAGRPEVRLLVDRQRVAEYGLTTADLASNLRTAFTGTADTKFRQGGSEYDLRVQLEESNIRHVTEIADTVVGMSASGQTVRVRDVARVQMAEGPSLIKRTNRQRQVTVSAYLNPALISMRTAEADITKFLRELDLGEVIWQWSGEVEQRQESFGNMGQALLLAIILVYLLMAALYNSVLEPLNVMLNLPAAIVGAGLGLLLCHMELTIISLLGIIMLMGLVGKNSILIVDFTNTLRKRGLGRTEALLQAGPTRMKPVIMTTMTAVMALIPTALAVNEGSEFRAPLAVAVIFGLLLATLVSLVLVPATYVIWDNVGVFFTRLGRRIFTRPTPAEPAAAPEEEDNRGGSY